jgi:hypothetical protein
LRLTLTHNPTAPRCTATPAQVSIIAANNDSVLERAVDGQGFDSENVSWPLYVTADGLRSRLWAAAPEAVRRTLTTQNATLNLHHECVCAAGWRWTAWRWTAWRWWWWWW